MWGKTVMQALQKASQCRRICSFAGSQPNIPPDHFYLATNTAKTFASKRWIRREASFGNEHDISLLHLIYVSYPSKFFFSASKSSFITLILLFLPSFMKTVQRFKNSGYLPILNIYNVGMHLDK